MVETEKPYDPLSDHKVIYTDTKGVGQEAYKFAKLFKRKPLQEQPIFASQCLNAGIKPFYVLQWVTDPTLKKQIGSAK